MKLLDTNHAFFKPLWIRLLIIAVVAAWGTFEFWTGSPFWGVIFYGFASVSFYGFFINFNPDGTK